VTEFTIKISYLDIPDGVDNVDVTYESTLYPLASQMSSPLT